MIQPTVGRVVWFYKYSPGQGHKGPLAAHVAHVFSDLYVNLMVIDEGGNPRPETSILLLQDDAGEVPASDYCTWMPYQKGQAAKTEQLEAQLGKSNIFMKTVLMIIACLGLSSCVMVGRQLPEVNVLSKKPAMPKGYVLAKYTVSCPSNPQALQPVDYYGPNFSVNEAFRENEYRQSCRDLGDDDRDLADADDE